MSSKVVVLVKLIFGLSCYVVVGSLFAWTSLWAEALGIKEELFKGKTLALHLATIIILALTLTWGLAWTKVGVVSWIKVLGWGWIVTCGVGLALGAVTNGITFTVIWVFVVGAAWVGAWSLLGAKSQLLLSFSQLNTLLILVGIGIFGMSLGALWRSQIR